MAFAGIGKRIIGESHIGVKLRNRAESKTARERANVKERTKISFERQMFRKIVQ